MVLVLIVKNFRTKNLIKDHTQNLHQNKIKPNDSHELELGGRFYNKQFNRKIDAKRLL